MQTIELFKEIVQQMDATDIPIKYIAAASHTDEYGMEEVYTGDELDALMAKRRRGEIGDIQVLLDLKTIATDVGGEIAELFARITDRVNKGDY